MLSWVMDMDTVIKTVVTVVGIILSLGYYPQAWRIWRSGRAVDVSITSYVIFAAGTTTLLLYGFYKDDFVIIASFFFGAIGSWLVLCLALYFKGK